MPRLLPVVAAISLWTAFLVASTSLSAMPEAIAHAGESASAAPACTLLTTSAVRVIYGGRVSLAAHRTIGVFDSCEYATHVGNLNFLLTTTTLIAERGFKYGNAPAWFEQIRSTTPGRILPLTRLGDRALWSVGLRQLWVLKGATLFSLSQFAPGNRTMAALERAAGSVLARLGGHRSGLS